MAAPTPNSAIPSPAATHASNPVRGRPPSDDEVVVDDGGWLESVEVAVAELAVEDATGVPELDAPEDEPEPEEPELEEEDVEDPELEEPDEPDFDEPEWLSGSVYC
jgi:hypothetical protein